LVTGKLNVDGWPEGAGMVEATGMGAIKLDVAVYTIRALNDLAELADSKGDSATCDWAATKASALTDKFRRLGWLWRERKEALRWRLGAIRFPIPSDWQSPIISRSSSR